MDRPSKQKPSSLGDLRKDPELPETIFSSDIEDKVYQGIVVNTLSSIQGIHLIEGSFFQALIGKTDKVKGIHIEQEPLQHSVKIQIEVNVQFGVSLPEKAEEIQVKVAQEVTKMTSVHVAEVHVMFRDLIPEEVMKEPSTPTSTLENLERSLKKDLNEDF